MAKLLPPYIDKNCKSTAEKLIFDIFKNSPFTKDWIVLHSLNLSQHTVRLYGEIDFLIMIPNAGVFVMEVKGGDVKCIDGVWHFTNRFKNTNTSNIGPFNQARDAMFSLRSAIEKEFGKKHKFSKILYGFLCAFPHINFDKHSVEYESWQILDKDSMQISIESYFNNFIQKFIQKHQSQKWFSEKDCLPNKNDLIVLCDFLRGDFERIRTVRERLDEFDNQIKTYTEEQFRILDSIQFNERSITQGSAGTGKTMIAIESAIRAAEEGKTVFLTCYNRLIGEWMEKQLENWKDRITVSNLHSFLFEQLRGFDYDQTQKNKQDFYSKYLPLLLRDFFEKGIKEKFDLLIIDEGQDLIREEYLQLFNSMVKGGLSNGNWEIYGDFERQAIFAQLDKEEMFSLIHKTSHPTKFLLKINCRNTKQIGEETALISGFEKSPFLLEHLEGIPVEYIFYKDKSEQNKLLAEQLKKLSGNKLPLSELIILSPRKFENSTLNLIDDFTIKEIKNTNEINTEQDFIGFSTVQSYKGMESNYVLITDIEDMSSEIAKSLLYVGMSRARYGLIMMLSETMRNDYKEILRKKFN
ncbi:nuclease-related domain-containing DEAD/DEAH box helicase [Flavobacterium sp. N1719]|uniref:nuclease-related domain-containing DEAD/DEAH box helicase n=1 Tax=Flavobacterium sp. N1719 TaxID=2885633 RepID=UPI002223548B|nr:NERD domain-containing protein [Flavobacterium sp. N1719]